MSIESDIAAITDGTPETIASIRMIYKAAADRAYENLRLLDDAILNHIEANGGNPVPSGATTELRATYPHETKLRKGAKVAVLKHLFDICLGDFGAAQRRRVYARARHARADRATRRQAPRGNGQLRTADHGQEH
jgi:hypothetical protein